MPRDRGARFGYGPWDGGADPLAPPFDVTAAMDAIGDAVLDGENPRQALQNLLRQGSQGRRGLDELRKAARERQRQIRQQGRLDGTLEEVRRLLDQAIGQERAELFPDPSDEARMAEMELDTLPNDTARAVRELSDYDWRSDDARASFEQLKEMLQQEVLDQQIKGMKQAMQNATPEDMARVKDMLSELSDMLEADSRGEHTQESFDDFMSKYGDYFPEAPANLEELTEALARRRAAADRLMRSMSEAQRQEMSDLVAGAMQDMGLAAEMSRLDSALRAARPDLLGPPGGRRGRGMPDRFGGEGEMGLSDATSALEELASLDELSASLGQDYPGATLDDVDPELVRDALGRAAVDDLRELQQIEKELQRQGFLRRAGDELELTPRALRQLGQTALRRVFSSMSARATGDHDIRDAGAAGERTGATRPWRFGDEQPIDTVRTVRNALQRGGLAGPGGRVKLAVEDFEVVETERRTSACVVLLVDLSYSMELRGTWPVAKQTALALHTLVTTRHPQDSCYIVGFSDYAREISPGELAGLDCEMVKGTNLQHALMIAGRRIAQHPDSDPMVLCITDGEPTAHLLRDGTPYFMWPPLPETLEATLVEVDRLTRRNVTINIFMLDDEPRLVDFVEGLARRNGGRVFSPRADRLGEYVVTEYLRAREGGRR